MDAWCRLWTYMKRRLVCFDYQFLNSPPTTTSPSFEAWTTSNFNHLFLVKDLYHLF